MANKNIYLDYAAATPMDKRVLLAMEPYFSTEFYNPSATYLVARAVGVDIEQARAKIAGLLGSRPGEIIFTSGATEANNLAIRGVAEAHPDGQILVSAIEHASVLAPAEHLKAKQIPVSTKGIVDLGWLGKNISAKTMLVSVMLVNNELGSVQPLHEIAELIKTERKSRQSSRNKLPIYLHTDAAQAANFFDLHVSRLGVDLMSVNGGKLYGPKQTGFLYVRAGTSLTAQIMGGGQEFGKRSGTENVAGIMALAEAFAIAQKTKALEVVRTKQLLGQMSRGLEKIFPAVQINGSAKHRAPHILSASFEGFDNERLMIELDERGIQVAVGSACSASDDEPSHVLSAIGLPESAAQATLRFSFGRQTSPSDIEKTLSTLQTLVS